MGTNCAATINLPLRPPRPYVSTAFGLASTAIASRSKTSPSGTSGAGMSPDEIVTEHRSRALADVHAALAYYYENRERIDAEVEAAKCLAEEMIAEHEDRF
jgi:hypothetical protein